MYVLTYVFKNAISRPFWNYCNIVKWRASSQNMTLKSHKISNGCMQQVLPGWAQHFSPKRCSFFRVFAHKSAILNFFKTIQKSSGHTVNMHIGPKLQLSSINGLCSSFVHGCTHGQRVNLYPPSGSVSPLGIKSPFCSLIPHTPWL